MGSLKHKAAPKVPAFWRHNAMYPSYNQALIKSSQKLRKECLTKRLPPPLIIESSPYKVNADYYRGKVKSVYETEPLFEDFVKNISPKETNLYDVDNMLILKKEFDNLVHEKGDLFLDSDPYNPSTTKVTTKTFYQPQADLLSAKHKNNRTVLLSLPCLSCYHRSTRKM